MDSIGTLICLIDDPLTLVSVIDFLHCQRSSSYSVYLGPSSPYASGDDLVFTLKYFVIDPAQGLRLVTPPHDQDLIECKY